MISKRESATNIYGSATSFPIPLSSISTPCNSKRPSKSQIISALQKPISGLLQKNDSLFSTKLLHIISLHLKNIFEAGELDETVVVAKIETTTQHGAIEGKMQTTESNFYNLDAIISVGYRVNSVQAEEKAEHEYDVFNKTQLIESDFDKEVKHLLEK